MKGTVHLIASRYKSQPVKVDEYFIPLVRYIHQNPIKAGIVGKLEEYRFSSYRDYVQGGTLTDTAFSLGLLGRDEWLRLHQISTNDHFDISGRSIHLKKKFAAKYCDVQKEANLMKSQRVPKQSVMFYLGN